MKPGTRDAPDVELDALLASVGQTRADLDREVRQEVDRLRRLGHPIEVRYDTRGYVSALRLRDA